MKNYSAPSAGSDGNYGAPTPHAAQVAQQPYTAPAGDGVNSGPGSGGAGLAAMDGLAMPTPTPGEAAEMPERYDES